MPAEAIFDGITKLQERFVDFFAHFAGRWRSEGGYLTVPTTGEVLAQVHEARKLAQGLKVFREARTGVFDLCCFDEVAPSVVSKKRERAKLAAMLEMATAFARDALLILERMFVRKLWTEFKVRFLSVGGFALNMTNEANELIP